ncbi:branched-chain amino acid transport system II carrier protein [Photobacterium atrarenae]|uniref:Branched-chain amino acid transport system carrier protein n=1 Tax=Photobacterium atrarenae TaxID=865757 RepID=A0ABY5GLY0_9GAMM|nr:branched-chain amino acid transport system II carrier protein [Photobacterium atrarenae]UTV29786.1 branched-chain amino acid transport system II carrier protein [Photobacterium atrarenae]
MKKRDITAIGFTTFALFLGAGNLIFPPMMAQQAGELWLFAMAGFLISAVGLPALTIIVLGRLSSASKLTSALPTWLDKTFWLTVFITLGPAFVLPRAVNVAYEMGIQPFTSTDQLLPFSSTFCAVSLLLAIRPGKLVDIIGKYMTPALIAMLSALVIAAIFEPQGTTTPARDGYQASPLTRGLLEGYMTLDAIAAVAFGWVIIQAIKAKGVEAPDQIRHYSYTIAGIYVVLMSGCYLAMGYLGATSSTIAANATNGGMLLTSYAGAILGPVGQSLLAIITLTACLTTVIGLTNANAEYFQQTYRLKFNHVATGVIILAAIVSNVGLEQLITFSLPLILTLCPVAVALILAACLPAEKTSSLKYLVYTAALFGSLDTLSVLALMPDGLEHLLQQWLPLYPQHLSWFIPSLLVLAHMVLRPKPARARQVTAS